MSGTDDFITTPCLNCGDTTPGRYCRACGQRKGDTRVSMRRLLGDVLEDQLSINAALPRTLKALFLHPGRLTVEYSHGRIASYIAPFRMYLVASLLFFLTLSVMNRVSRARNIAGDTAAAPDTTAIPTLPVSVGPRRPQDSTRVDSTTRAGNGLIGFTITAGQDGEAQWNINTGNETLDAMLEERVRRLEGVPADQAVREVVSGFIQAAPTAMFVMLPVFALLLQILYITSRRYYVEHFVFALHYHAFAFLLFTAIIILPEFLHPQLLLIWLLLYLPIALKKVYAKGWLETGVKWFVLFSVYNVLIAFGVVATAVAAFLLT